MVGGQKGGQATRGEIVITAAGALMLIFSFLDFSAKQTIWQKPWFPLATLMPLYGVIMAVQIAITRFGNVKLGARVAGFTWEQIHLALGLDGRAHGGWLVDHRYRQQELRFMDRGLGRDCTRGRRGHAPTRAQHGRGWRVNNTKLTPGNIVIMVGGVLALIGSFLPYYHLPASIFVRSSNHNAWSTGLFIIVTMPALLALAMGVVAGLESFASRVSVPARVLGFSLNQVHLILAFQATLMIFAVVLQNYPGVDKGVGMYLTLFAAIACLLGAILRAVRNGPQRRPSF